MPELPGHYKECEECWMRYFDDEKLPCCLAEDGITVTQDVLAFCPYYNSKEDKHDR